MVNNLKTIATMKKQILLFTAAILFCVGSLMAQEGFKRQTPEERTKGTMEKLADLKLEVDVTKKAEVIFADFYIAQQKSMEEMRASGNMDREAMKASRDKLAAERDAKLKLIFTEAQYKKWIGEIEPTTHPQRPQKN